MRTWWPTSSGASRRIAVTRDAELLEALLRDRPDHAGALVALGELELVRGREKEVFYRDKFYDLHDINRAPGLEIYIQAAPEDQHYQGHGHAAQHMKHREDKVWQVFIRP